MHTYISLMHTHIGKVMKKAFLALFALCATASAHGQHYAPGDVVPAAYLKAHGTRGFFSVEAIGDSVFGVMQRASFSKDCTTRRSELRYLRCLHTTAEGHTVVGEMVLHRSIADKVLAILRRLYEAHYPIERMRLVDNYGGDDERSMTANNSSGFNFRRVSGSNVVSKHGRGLAVDINPLYNPCRRTLRSGQVKIEPAKGAPYADRTKDFAYKIKRGDLCCRLFKEAGFRWGGDWKHTKDYQHFEMP